MDKLKVPQTAITDSNGRLSPAWERFFENMVRVLRSADVAEIGTGDAEQNGNWRIIQSGNNLVVQRKESGTWTTKETFTP